MTDQDSSKDQEKTTRRVTILKLLGNYEQPILLSKFIADHVVEIGLEDDDQGRHAATVYVNRMVTMGDVGKKKEGRNPYIYIPSEEEKMQRRLENKSRVHTRKMNPKERKKKIASILHAFGKAFPLAKFIKAHIADLGYDDPVKSQATLRAFLYRMAERDVLLLEKINKSLYISLTDHGRTTLLSKAELTAQKPSPQVEQMTGLDEKSFDVFDSEPKLVQTMTSKPESDKISHSLEALIETKIKLIESLEELDRQLEAIVEKKKNIRQKRDEILLKIREHF